MLFSKLVMANVPRLIFMTFCQQRACVDTPEGELEPLKSMHNMIFRGIVIDNSKGDKNSAIFLTGMPGHYIEDISISDVQFIVSGGGTEADAQKTNLNEYSEEVLGGWWPEFKLVGTLPAHGIYARHINGLTIDNVSIQTVTKDARPAVVFDDVINGEALRIKSNNKSTAPVTVRYIK